MADGFQREFDEAEGLEKAIYALAIAVDNCAYRIKYLGNGNAATQMGAIEAFSVVIKESFERLADSVEAVSMAIPDKK